jgi:hypothetical protein
MLGTNWAHGKSLFDLDYVNGDHLLAKSMRGLLTLMRGSVVAPTSPQATGAIGPVGVLLWGMGAARSESSNSRLRSLASRPAGSPATDMLTNRDASRVAIVPMVTHRAGVNRP